MCQRYTYFEKEQFKMLVMFPFIFVADTKIISNHNFVAPFRLKPKAF